MTGHQLLGGYITPKVSLLLIRAVASSSETVALSRKDNAWLLYYNFDQYLYEPQKGSGKGLGIFGRLGLSDGNPNPMNGFFSVGIGGKGIVPADPWMSSASGTTILMSPTPRSLVLSRPGRLSGMNMEVRHTTILP